MARNTRIPPMPVDDFAGIFDANPNNIELTPGAYTHVADWMRMAVTMACGPTTSPEDVLLFAQIWTLTHSGSDSRTRATRSWFAARMGVVDPDTVTASANHLVAAGLIAKETETKRKLVRDPETGKFAPIDVPTTNWRLSVRDDSPAVQAALAWDRGEGEEQQREAEKKYRALNELKEMSAFGGEIIDRVNPDALAALTDDDGHINLDLLAAAVTQTLIGMGVISTSDNSASADATTESSAQTTLTPTIDSPASDDPEGWAELIRVTRNKNLIGSAKESYRALLAEGYDPDVIRAAWIARQKNVKEDRYSPQLLKWLKGEARDCIAREEGRQRKTRGVVAVESDDTFGLCVFAGDDHAPSKPNPTTQQKDALPDGGEAIDEMTATIAAKNAAGEHLSDFERMVINQNKK